MILLKTDPSPTITYPVLCVCGHERSFHKDGVCSLCQCDEFVEADDELRQILQEQKRLEKAILPWGQEK
jgi:hypothetical protein